MSLTAWMLLAALIFSVGLVGLFTRRNAVAVLLCVELMANAVNLNLVAIGYYRGDLEGQAMALFGIALTVAEVIVGLAIVILMNRTHKTIDIDSASEFQG